MLRSLPNALSLLRILISVLILATYSGKNPYLYSLAIALIALAILTDVLDGYLARRLKVTSELGYILDGLGDRAAYVAIILCLVLIHSVPLFIAWLFIFREVLVYALRLLRKNWYRNNKPLRKYSRWHALGIRLWFLLYLAADGLRIFTSINLYRYSLLGILQHGTAIITIIIAYWGLYLAATSEDLKDNILTLSNEEAS